MDMRVTIRSKSICYNLVDGSEITTYREDVRVWPYPLAIRFAEMYPDAFVRMERSYDEGPRAYSRYRDEPREMAESRRSAKTRSEPRSEPRKRVTGYDIGAHINEEVAKLK